MALSTNDKLSRLLQERRCNSTPQVQLDYINRLASIGLPRRVPHSNGSLLGGTENKENLAPSVQEQKHGHDLDAAGNRNLSLSNSTESKKRKVGSDGADPNFHGQPHTKHIERKFSPCSTRNNGFSSDFRHKSGIEKAKGDLSCQDQKGGVESRKHPFERNVEPQRLQTAPSSNRIGSFSAKQVLKPRVGLPFEDVPHCSISPKQHVIRSQSTQGPVPPDDQDHHNMLASADLMSDVRLVAPNTGAGRLANCPSPPVPSMPLATACSITIRTASAPLATYFTDENALASSLENELLLVKPSSGNGGHERPLQQECGNDRVSPEFKEERSGRRSPLKVALVENRAMKTKENGDIPMSDLGAPKGGQNSLSKRTNTIVQTKKQGENEHFVWVNGKRYQKLKKVGRGGSSIVYKVIDQYGEIYALKRIKLKGRDYATASGFYQEIELLSRLHGKSYIIELIDHEVTDKQLFMHDKEGSHIIRHDAYIYMVLEYGKTDLATMLQEKLKERSQGGKDIDEAWIRHYWQQILEAVNTVHEERIVHADLKPANFLVVEGVLKLIDFGIAKSIQNDTTNIERDAQVGTLNYMSPEAFLMNEQDEHGNTIKCGRPSDIWALGCILYQMVYGKTPFAHITALHAKIREVANPKHKINFPPISNPHLLDIMKRCLAYRREDRLRIPELLTHPFLKPHLVRLLEDLRAEERQKSVERLEALILDQMQEKVVMTGKEALKRLLEEVRLWKGESL